jgi:hypothetical protein
MKQKRNNAVTNGQLGSMLGGQAQQQQRDGSNDPYEFNQQRIDTGGGDYMQQYEDEINYNNRFSPKNGASNGQKMMKKKTTGQSQPPQSNEDWSSSVNVSMINR